MGRLLVQAHEVPSIVVRCLRLRNLVVGLGLDGVDQIWELDRVLNVEDGDVVSNQIPVTLIRVQTGGETTRITNGVGTTPRTADGGESDIGRSDFSGIGKDLTLV